MSKCQRSKFFAGGKAGAGTGGGQAGGSGPAGELGTSMAALLAARDAQDKMWTTPAATSALGAAPKQLATPALTQLAVVTTQPANYKQMSKEEMMKIICSGDMSDDE